jgi:hypothetical protein
MLLESVWPCRTSSAGSSVRRWTTTRVDQISLTRRLGRFAAERIDIGPHALSKTCHEPPECTSEHWITEPGPHPYERRIGKSFASLRIELRQLGHQLLLNHEVRPPTGSRGKPAPHDQVNQVLKSLVVSPPAIQEAPTPGIAARLSTVKGAQTRASLMLPYRIRGSARLGHPAFAPARSR